MAKTNKRQRAREMAQSALAEKIARQQKIQDAAQRGFLAQADFDEARERLASALQELEALGESQGWMRESFGLTPSELKSLLTLPVDDDDADNDAEDEPADASPGEENSDDNAEGNAENDGEAAHDEPGESHDEQ